MKKTFLALLCILSSLFSYGQNTFSSKILGSDDIVVLQSVENNGSYYMAATKNILINNPSKAWLYKMTNQGILADSALIDLGEGNSWSYCVLSHKDTLHIIYAKKENSVAEFYIAKYSSDLEFISRRSCDISIDGSIIIVESDHQDQDGFDLLITCLGCGSYMFKMTWDGEITFQKAFSIPPTFIMDFCFREIDTTYYILINESSPDSKTFAVELDNTFNEKRRERISRDTICLTGNIICFDNQSILASGRHYIRQGDDIDKNTSLLKLDSLFTYCGFTSIGSIDTSDLSPVGQYLTYNSDSSFILMTYTKNYDQLSTVAPIPTWISVVGLDNNLNILWHRYYGGDYNYYVYSMIATSDGGVLINATQYDWNTQYNERDALLLKLNSDGLLTSTPENPTLRPHHAIVYPNPGSNALKVEAGPQIFGATFELFDMGGQRVAMQTLQSSVTAINTAPLTSGVYPWRIISKGEVVEEGKWVKE